MSSQNRTNIPNSLNEHWMPFSDNRNFKKNNRLIIDAKGVYLTNHEGKKMIDASSGLFCNPLGHGRREITEAVTKQLDKLDYCQPFNQGFGGSFELATRIAKKTPGDLNKIFYTICGSTAVETAIKIAVAYHRAKGNGHRFKFIGRERGYHGMNTGATTVGGMINNVKAFASILMTYFGVNFYLVGLHSYASGDKIITPNFVYYAIVIISLLGTLSYWRFNKFYKK